MSRTLKDFLLLFHISVLMKESKLTTTQKQGFQAVLRSGKNFGENSERSEQRREFLRRRAVRGRAMGLDIDPNEGMKIRSAFHQVNLWHSDSDL